MNKNHIIVAAVVAVAVVGGIYFYMHKAPQSPQGGEQGATEQTTAAPRTLRELLALGTSQKCTFTNTTANASSDGVVYMSGGHMRGDFTTKASSGEVVMSHMISDGTEMRMWQDGQTTGFIMKMDAQANATATTPQQNQSPVGYDDPNVKYDCNAWVADNSLFTPPTTVTFKTMAEMTAGAMMAKPTGGSDAGMGPGMEAGGGADMKVMQCNACNGAPTEAAKAQCRAALQCS